MIAAEDKFITNQVQSSKVLQSSTTQIIQVSLFSGSSKRQLAKGGDASIKPVRKRHSAGGWSAPAEGPSHSTDQPGGRVQGQVRLAIKSSKLVPENSATSKAEYTNTQQDLPVTGYNIVR